MRLSYQGMHIFACCRISPYHSDRIFFLTRQLAELCLCFCRCSLSTKPSQDAFEPPCGILQSGGICAVVLCHWFFATDLFPPYFCDFVDSYKRGQSQRRLTSLPMKTDEFWLEWKFLQPSQIELRRAHPTLDTSSQLRHTGRCNVHLLRFWNFLTPTVARPLVDYLTRCGHLFIFSRGKFCSWFYCRSSASGLSIVSDVIDTAKQIDCGLRDKPFLKEPRLTSLVVPYRMRSSAISRAKSFSLSPARNCNILLYFLKYSLYSGWQSHSSLFSRTHFAVKHGLMINAFPSNFVFFVAPKTHSLA